MPPSDPTAIPPGDGTAGTPNICGAGHPLMRHVYCTVPAHSANRTHVGFGHSWPAAPSPSGDGPGEPHTHDLRTHDVGYFVRALSDAALIIGKTNGLDMKLLGAAHLLNHYAERMRAIDAAPPPERARTRTMDELPAESRAELEEFGAHLRSHRDVAQTDCRFCLLRLSRRAAEPEGTSAAERMRAALEGIYLTVGAEGEVSGHDGSFRGPSWRTAAEHYGGQVAEVRAYLARVMDLVLHEVRDAR